MSARTQWLFIVGGVTSALVLNTPIAAQETCGAWAAVPSPDPDGAESAIIRDIVAVGPNEAWAVGSYNRTVQGQVNTFAFAMHWNGQTWVLVPTPQPSACGTCVTNVALWAVDALGPNDVWAGGAQTIQSTDGFLGTHILVM